MSKSRSVLLAQPPAVHVLLFNFSYRIMKGFQEREGDNKDQETELLGVPGLQQEDSGKCCSRVPVLSHKFLFPVLTHLSL